MNGKIFAKSEKAYEFFLKLYPESYRKEFGDEMKFVFSECLKDAYRLNGNHGLLSFWTRTILDALKSLYTQHIENRKESGFMKKNKHFIMKNRIFVWIAAITAAILTVPYLAIQFKWVTPDPNNPMDRGVDWSIADFVLMGILIFGSGSLFVMISRSTPKKYRMYVGLAVLTAFLLIWAHLAVGIVDNWPLAGS